MTSIKLKDDDKVVDITYSKARNVLIITNNGFALAYDIEEVPVIGTKGSGVKAINLKDDFVASGTLFNNEEFVAIITDKGTGKRVRLKEIERTSRARKGIMIIREVKTNPHKVIKAFVTDSKGMFGIKIGNDIITVKASELTIMDRYSTGSNISKGGIAEVFLISSIKDAEKETEVEETITEEVPVIEQTEYKQLSLLDIDQDLDKIDNMLDNIDEEL
jgi:topoisomerase-4 subunit A